jgi:hypothetical protein
MLKIIFSDNVDYGLPDHLVEQSCCGVLERLRKRPNDPQTHRTGQQIVWQKLQSLLATDYSLLAGFVEFHTIEGRVL